MPREKALKGYHKMAWTVRRIQESDYGCEERTEEERNRVIVTLEDGEGLIRQLTADDGWLYAMGIDEGSVWPEEERPEETGPEETKPEEIKPAETEPAAAEKKTIRVVAAVIRRGNTVFATQRGYGDYKDWWEFPGGKIETGETPEAALIREINEELDSDIVVEQYLTTVEHDYPEFHLSMDCYWCTIEGGKLTLIEHEAAKWLPLDNLRQVNWLPADVKVVEAIERSQLSAEKSEVHGTAELRTEKLLLRRYMPEDAELLYRQLGTDPEIDQYSGWNPYATPEMAKETVHRFIDSYGGQHSYSWVMETDGVLVGTIGAYDYKDDQIEVGYSVVREWRGRGFASEALKKVLDYLTGNEGIACVTAWCAADHTGSIRVLEKAGMRLAGTETGGLVVGDLSYDKLNYEYRGGCQSPDSA